MMIDFSKLLKADLSGEEGGAPRKYLVPGTYPAMISGVGRKTFDSGAVAIELTYSVTEGEYASVEITERVFIITGALKGNKEIARGYGTLMRRLLSAGFTAEQVGKFKPGKSDQEPGDLRKLIGKEFNVVVDLGKPYTNKHGKEITRAEVIRAEALVTSEDQTSAA